MECLITRRGGGIDISDSTIAPNFAISPATFYDKDGIKQSGVIDEQRNKRIMLEHCKSNAETNIILSENGTAIGEDFVCNGATEFEIDGSMFANAIGLTADKLKIGEQMLGIVGAYGDALIGQKSYSLGTDIRSIIIDCITVPSMIMIEGMVMDNNTDQSEYNIAYVIPYVTQPSPNGAYKLANYHMDDSNIGITYVWNASTKKLTINLIGLRNGSIGLGLNQLQYEPYIEFSSVCLWY